MCAHVARQGGPAAMCALHVCVARRTCVRYAFVGQQGGPGRYESKAIFGATRRAWKMASSWQSITCTRTRTHTRTQPWSWHQAWPMHAREGGADGPGRQGKPGRVRAQGAASLIRKGQEAIAAVACWLRAKNAGTALGMVGQIGRYAIFWAWWAKTSRQAGGGQARGPMAGRAGRGA